VYVFTHYDLIFPPPNIPPIIITCHYPIASVRLLGNEFHIVPQEFEDQQPAEFLCNLMKHCSGYLAMKTNF